MKAYNRALDYTVLALDEMRKGKTTLAARLFAKAVEQPDVTQAIAILEASNRHAFALQAKQATPTKAAKAVKADEAPMDDEGEPAVEDVDFSEDPLNEIESDVDDSDADDSDEEGADEEVDLDESADPEVAPAEAMAKVLSNMVRKSRK